MEKNPEMRKTLEGLEQYTSEVHFKKLRELDNFKKILKLDGNENLFMNPKIINKIILDSLDEIDTTIYTDTTCEDLRISIADHYNINAENIMVGNGADGILDTIVKTFLDTSSEAIVIEPTYSIYKFFIKIMGAKYKSVLLEKDFSLEPDKVLKAIEKNSKIIFICSPNNPTGNQFNYANLLKILDQTDCIVVIDEAYAEYGNYSLIPSLKKYPNLIITKTMSKAYGLASLRAGYCLGDPKIIENLLKISPPYPVNIVAQKIIPKVLKKTNLILDIIKKVKIEREFIYNQIMKINSLEAFKSDANFLLFKVVHKDLRADDVHKRLVQKGVIVRNRSTLPLLENCLRITISPRETTDEFLKRLKIIMG